MSFSELLQSYIETLHCNASDLAQASGLSKSVISRYLSGKQLPSSDGASVQKLAQGICAISKRQTALSPDAKQIELEFTRSLTGISISFEQFCKNLQILLEALSIGNNELARALSYDPSYISRVLTGTRRPGNLPQFLSDVSDYIARRFADSSYSSAIIGLTGCSQDQTLTATALSAVVRMYLGSNTRPEKKPLEGFLVKLDEFDLNKYIRAIHFDELKVPTAPFQLPTAKIYSGISEMMQAELDFLKAAVLSKSKEDVILYSDMPLEDMAEDKEFPKKWMLGMAMLLRKGLRLHQIHEVHRPFPEMMLGLEGWIPMYMTGQIIPYYLPDATNQTFLHFLRTAGSVAVVGEAIAGHQAEGRYIVTKNKADVQYYRQRANALLRRAKPLMQIYRNDQADAFRRQLSNLWKGNGTYRCIYSVPPFYTLSGDLLAKLLADIGIPSSERKNFMEFHQIYLESVLHTLNSGSVILELPDLDNEEFDAHPLSVSLSEFFLDREIRYTRDIYREHLSLTKQFAKKHPALRLHIDPASPFRNIQITVREGDYALVSKSTAPAIHFLMKHPAMITAFENFVVPLRD